MMAAFPLLLLVLVVAAPSPLLRPDADSDNDNGSAASSAPASSHPSSAHSPAPSSALRSAATPSPADKEGDYNKKKKEKAPPAMEVKAGSGSAEEQPQKAADVAKRREEMNGGTKVDMFHFSSSHHYKMLCFAAPGDATPCFSKIKRHASVRVEALLLPVMLQQFLSSSLGIHVLLPFFFLLPLQETGVPP
ncbi:uncharacterized protein LOC119293203 [Triticum dicoccoides]|uniref:uncharacterized protein LOC119293203 n=1 Tax=Triticum dicoccoides TaxID=85692 RepID=UPI00188FA27F|nr:uncharacterized protein LOC119293203 [Triticum dicoccoides]